MNGWFAYGFLWIFLLGLLEDILEKFNYLGKQIFRILIYFYV